MKLSCGTELAHRIADTAPALLIGSMAVQRIAPELLDHFPRDIDFLVPRASLVRVVKSVPMTWTSWSEPLVLGETQLDGRLYVRGRDKDMVVDLTYESLLDWETAWSRRIAQGGLAIANPHDLARLYEARNRTGDSTLAEQLRQAQNRLRSRRTWQAEPCRSARSRLRSPV